MDGSRKRGHSDEEDSPHPTRRRITPRSSMDDSGIGCDDSRCDSDDSSLGVVTILPPLLDSGSASSATGAIGLAINDSTVQEGTPVSVRSIQSTDGCNDVEVDADMDMESWARDLPRLAAVSSAALTGRVEDDPDEEDKTWEKASGSTETSESENTSGGGSDDIDTNSNYGSNQGGGYQIVQHLMGNRSIDEHEAYYIMGHIPLPRLAPGEVLELVDVNEISTNETYRDLLPHILELVSVTFVRRVPELFRNLTVFNVNVAGVNAVFMAIREFILALNDDERPLTPIMLMEFLYQAMDIWFDWADDRVPYRPTDIPVEGEGRYGRVATFITDELLAGHGKPESEAEVSSDNSRLNSSGL